jgi:hypothetical protein
MGEGIMREDFDSHKEWLDSEACKPEGMPVTIRLCSYGVEIKSKEEGVLVWLIMDSDLPYPEYDALSQLEKATIRKQGNDYILDNRQIRRADDEQEGRG